jgi:hypothetical protein
MLPDWAKESLLTKPVKPGPIPTVLPSTYRLLGNNEEIQPGDLSYCWNEKHTETAWYPVFNEIYFGETVEVMNRYRGVVFFFARYDPFKITPILSRQVIESLLDK